MKQHFKNLFVVCVVVGLILAALELVIDNPYSQNILRSIINRSIAQSSNVSVTFESLRINLIPMEVDLFGIKVVPESQISQVALADIVQLKIRVSLVSLFFGQPKVSILADGLNMHWPPPADFKGFLKETQKTSKESSWPLKDVSLRNTQVLIDFSADKPNSRLHLGGLNLDVHFKDMMVFKGNLAVETTDLMLASKPLLEGVQINSNLSMNHDSFALDQIWIHSPLYEFTTNLKGALSLKNPQSRYMRIDGKIQGKTDLTILDKTLDLKNSHGHLRLWSKLFVHIPFSKLEDSAFSAEGNFIADDAYVDGNRIYDTTSKFVADNQGIKLKDTRIIIDKTEHALVSGSIDFNEKVDLNFSGRISSFPFSTIISSFGGKFEDVDFDASSESLKVYGTAQPFQLEVTAAADLRDLRVPTLKLNSKRFKEKPSCRSHIHLLINPQRLLFNDTSAVCFLPPANATSFTSAMPLSAPVGARHSSQVQIRNFIDFKNGPNMTIVGKDVDLALARSIIQVELSGTAGVETHIEEKNQKVLIEGDFRVKPLSIETLKLANAQGKFRVIDKAIHWENVHATQNILDLQSAKGYYDWEKDLLSFDAQAQKVDRTFVSNFFTILTKRKSPVQFGIESLQGKFELPLNSLMQSHNTVQAELSPFIYEEEELATQLSITGEQNRNTFHAHSLKALVGKLRLDADVLFRKRNFNDVISGEDEIEASFSSLSPEDTDNHFEALPYVSKPIAALHMFGHLNANGKVYGKFKELDGYFNVQGTKLSTSRNPLAPIGVKGFVNKAKVQLFTSQPGDNFLGRMDFDFTKNGIPFDWYFKLKQLDLKAFVPYLNKDARNYAYFSGQWSWKGTLKNWWASQGSLVLDNLNLAFYPPEGGPVREGLFVKTTQSAKFLLNPKGWTLENGKSFKLAGPGSNFEFLLRDSKPPERLGLMFRSSIDMSIVPKLSNLVQTGTGTLGIDTSIDGPIHQFKVVSHIYSESSRSSNVPAMSLFLPDISPSFQDINVDITYDDGQLLIQDLSARKGKGRMQMSGNFNLLDNPNAKASRVKLNLDQVAFDFAVPYLKSVHSVLGGDIILSGLQAPYDVVGNLQISRAETDQFLDIEAEAIKELSSRHLGPVFLESAKPIVNFNLAIEANKSMAIQSKSLTLNMSSNLVLKGTNEKPLLNGVVQVDKGQFRYKRDFAVSRGELIFDNPLRNDPKIDITATAQINTYTITIFISGNASKPLVDIIVDPATKDDGSPISRLDAIVLLSTGRLPSTETGRSEDTRNVVVTTGLNLYAAQLPFDKFNELTGQKWLSPYVNYTTDEQGNPVPQLNLPIHITELVEALIQQIPNRTSATIQIPLHDNISFSGSAVSTQRTNDNISEQQQTQSGLDLKFAFPFK